MDEEIDVFGGGESPDYQRGWRDGSKDAEGKGAEVLAALKVLTDRIVDLRLETVEDTPWDNDVLDLRAVRAAIAKAEGKGAS